MYIIIVGLITIIAGIVTALDNDGVGSINATMTMMTGIILVALGIISHRLHAIKEALSHVVLNTDTNDYGPAKAGKITGRVKCPKCQHINPKLAVRCDKCGHDFNPPGSPATGITGLITGDAEDCPNCNHINPKLADRCDKCGHDFNPPPVYCPECETKNDHKAVQCVKCQHKLGGG